MSGFRSMWERKLGKTESPIEAMFLDAFCGLAIEHGYQLAKRSSQPHSVIHVQTQPWVDNYRVDFLIRYRFYEETIEVAVECDGHEFHDRTKEQAIKDRRRDRDVQAAGIIVCRFTGSELNGRPASCAADVLNLIMDFQTAAFMRAFDVAQREAA